VHPSRRTPAPAPPWPVHYRPHGGPHHRPGLGAGNLTSDDDRRLGSRWPSTRALGSVRAPASGSAAVTRFRGTILSQVQEKPSPVAPAMVSCRGAPASFDPPAPTRGPLSSPSTPPRERPRPTPGTSRRKTAPRTSERIGCGVTARRGARQGRPTGGHRPGTCGRTPLRSPSGRNDPRSARSLGAVARRIMQRAAPSRAWWQWRILARASKWRR